MEFSDYCARVIQIWWKRVKSGLHSNREIVSSKSYCVCVGYKCCNVIVQKVLTEDAAVKKIQAAWRGYKVLSMNSPESVCVVCGNVGQEDVQLLSETDQLQTER